MLLSHPDPAIAELKIIDFAMATTQRLSKGRVRGASANLTFLACVHTAVYNVVDPLLIFQFHRAGALAVRCWVVGSFVLAASSAKYCRKGSCYIGKAKLSSRHQVGC